MWRINSCLRRIYKKPTQTCSTLWKRSVVSAELLIVDVGEGDHGRLWLQSNTLTVDSEQEKTRQKHFINLIPSENFTSQAVLDALGSPMQSELVLRHAAAFLSNVVPCKINTRRDIPEHDTMAETSSSTRQNGSVRSEPWTHSASTRRNGVSTYKVRLDNDRAKACR